MTLSKLIGDANVTVTEVHFLRAELLTRYERFDICKHFRSNYVDYTKWKFITSSTKKPSRKFLG